MGGKIRVYTKKSRQWLEGYTRLQIARDNQIGTGTVSEIIKEVKSTDSEAQIDLLRETAVILRRQGLEIGFFAQSIRLKRILDGVGLTDQQVEDFALHLSLHCFKRGLKPDEFMDVMTNISCFSDDLGFPVEELPRYITRAKTLIEKLYQEIEDVKIKQKLVMEKYNATMTDLEEFRRDKHLLEALRGKVYFAGEEAKREISEYEWFVSDHEMKLINKELEQPIGVTELTELAKDLLHHPSKYAEIIRTLRQRSELASTSSK